MNKALGRMVESAVMVAAATVLSILSFPGPWALGGSVTLCSMLPLVLIASRHGTGWGLVTAFVYSLVQLLLGIQNVQYAPNAAAAAGVIALDYLLPFTLIGFSASFRKLMRTPRAAVMTGIAVTFTGRFLCHFLSGVIIWEALFPNALEWAPELWSLAYNGSYMLPETLITLTAAWFSFKPLERFWLGGSLSGSA